MISSFFLFDDFHYSSYMQKQKTNPIKNPLTSSIAGGNCTTQRNGFVFSLHETEEEIKQFKSRLYQIASYCGLSRTWLNLISNAFNVFLNPLFFIESHGRKCGSNKLPDSIQTVDLVTRPFVMFTDLYTEPEDIKKKTKRW